MMPRSRFCFTPVSVPHPVSSSIRSMLRIRSQPITRWCCHSWHMGGGEMQKGGAVAARLLVLVAVLRPSLASASPATLPSRDRTVAGSLHGLRAQRTVPPYCVRCSTECKTCAPAPTAPRRACPQCRQPGAVRASVHVMGASAQPLAPCWERHSCRLTACVAVPRSRPLD
jgi:hypothetical protein